MTATDVAFARDLEQHGSRTAVVTEDGLRLSYAELAGRADAFGARFGAAKRLVAIEGANTLDCLVAYLGALRGGHAVLLVAGGSPERGGILERYGPAFVCREGEGGYVVEGGEPGPELHPKLSLLLSTSGTTGSAKLVRLSGASVQANAVSIVEYLGLGPEERAITSLPMHYSYGLSVINSHLLCGATLLLTARSVIEPEFWDFARREGVTSIAGVPYTYELLERGDFRRWAPQTLRTMTQAGGRLPVDLVRTYGEWAAARGVRFFVMYGQTEATARMAFLPPERLLEKAGSIGIAIPGGRFRLEDDDGNELELPDAPGELVYAGPNVMMGYAETPEDLRRGRELEELRTGDIAARDADGFYRIVGRRSRFAKVFGLRVNLDDVEALLQRQGVRAAAASDDRIIAVAVLSPADPGEVAGRLGAAFKLPAEVFVVSADEELPTLPSGKIDYRRILSEATEVSPAADDSLPAQARITAAFAKTFRREVLPHDTFVSLGGDSLNYVTLSLEIEDILGRLPDRWEQLSIAELQAIAPRVAARGLFAFRAIDTDIVLRAMAITAVVMLHVSNLVVGGGSLVLLMLVGYNMARYQKPKLLAGRGVEILKPLITRIILPYYALLLIYLAIKREFDVPSLLLFSNYVGRRGSLVEPFWFMEALLQCTILIVALMSLRSVRAFAARDPWRFGLGLLAASLAAKAAVASAFQTEHLLSRTADAVMFLVAYGWCVQHAQTVGRRVVVSMLAAGFAAMEVAHVGFWPALPPPADRVHALWLLLASLALIWAPRVPAPNLLHGVLTTIAAASFYIYLSHVIPVQIVYWWLGEKNLLLNLALALAGGVAVWWVAQRDEMWRGLVRRLKRS